MDLSQLLAQAWEQASANEFFQGGFLLGILAWIGMQLKSIPMDIWDRIERRIKYVVYLDNTNELYTAFAEWYFEKYPQSFKRVEAKMETAHKEGIKTFLLKIRQYGDINFIRYRAWFIYIRKDKVKLEAARDRFNVFIESYTISALFGRRIINRMLKEVHEYWQEKHGGKVGLRCVITDKFAQSHTIYHTAYKQLEHIYLDGKQDLVDDINNFMAKQDLYKRKGIKFKRGYLLYGPPGTGKTSLIFGIADWLDMPIYYLNPSGFTSDDSFEDFILNIDDWSIILIEDVDVFWTNRDDAGSVDVSFQSLLNVLDGLHSPNNVLIFMTTNKPDNFDEAFMRKGRLDYKMLVDHPSREMVRQYVSNFYEEECGEITAKLGDIPMVDIQDICIKNDNIKLAINKINNYGRESNS